MIEQLSVIVALLVALSVAAERLVDIFKNIVPFLRDEQKAASRLFWFISNNNDGWLGVNRQISASTLEGFRKAALQILAVVAGIITVFLARPAIESVLPGVFSTTGIIALGLLASGGSGFWNSVATYVLKVKDVRKVQVEKVEAEKNKIEAQRAQIVG